MAIRHAQREHQTQRSTQYAGQAKEESLRDLLELSSGTEHEDMDPVRLPGIRSPIGTPIQGPVPQVETAIEHRHIPRQVTTTC